MIATGLPGETPSVRLRYDGPKNRAPVVARVPHGRGRAARSCGASAGGPDRTATWDGRVSAGPEQTEPAPEGDYAFTVAVRDKAGNLTEAPRPAAARVGCAAAHGRLGAGLHPARPAVRGPRRRVRPPRGGPGGPELRLRRSRGSATRSRCCAAAASAAASASAFRTRCAPACTSCGSGRATTAPCGRSPWPGCRRGAPAARRARSSCFRRSPGRGSTGWTTTPTASRTGCRSRTPCASTGRSPAVGCRRASRRRCRRCCAGSTASGSHTTSPPTSRSPAARGRRSATRPGSRSPAASCGCPASCCGGCATTWRTADASRRSARTPSSAR